MRLALAACSLGSDIWTEAAAEYDEDDIVQSCSCRAPCPVNFSLSYNIQKVFGKITVYLSISLSLTTFTHQLL